MTETKKPTIRKISAAPPQPGSKWRRKSNGHVYILMGYGLMEKEGKNYAIYRSHQKGGVIWLTSAEEFFVEFDFFKEAPKKKGMPRAYNVPTMPNDPRNPPDPKARTFTHADIIAAAAAKKRKMN